MTVFKITQPIRCHCDFSLSILNVLPDLTIAEMRVDNHTLTILRELTETQVQAIGNAIATIESLIALRAAAKREQVDTFACFQGKSAKRWKAMLDPHKRRN